MKSIGITAFTLIMMMSLLFANPVDFNFQKNHVMTLQHMDVNIDGSELIFRCHQDSTETVIITEEYQLIVNGKDIELKPGEQKLVMDVYNETFTIIQEALRIARKGVKLGLKGARVGLSAAFEALVAAIMGEDEENIEARVEAKTNALEREAQHLEAEGDALEERAEALEKLITKLFDTVAPLPSLSCFHE